MSENLVVDARHLGKAYRIYDNPADRLKDILFAPLGRSYGRDFLALHDVSFTVERGETFAIIGRNGSGKSTLLQLLAGILAPTSGDLSVSPHIASLLELGSGFNPEFTGRENVFVNAAFHGLSRRETAARYDEIASFADIGGFIDLPVKIYSSGMFMRLAFAISVHMEPDLLLLDEVLAVGDVFFQQKCYERFKRLQERGTAIVLVTHSMGDVLAFCSRSLVLDQGRQVFLGNANEAVEHYLFLEQASRTGEAYTVTIPLPAAEAETPTASFVTADWVTAPAPVVLPSTTEITNGGARCVAFEICDTHDRPRRQFSQGTTACVYYEFEVLRDMQAPMGGLWLEDHKGIVVHGKHSLQYDVSVPPSVRKGQRVRFRQEIVLALAVGEYSVSFGIGELSESLLRSRSKIPSYQLDAEVQRVCIRQRCAAISVTARPSGHPAALTHYGVADLPGNIEVTVT